MIAAKQTVINELNVVFFSIKYRYSDILLKTTKTSCILLIKLFGLSEKWILIGLNPHATELILFTPVPAKKGAFSCIVLRVMHLTHTRGLIQFSNCAGLPRV